MYLLFCENGCSCVGGKQWLPPCRNSWPQPAKSDKYLSHVYVYNMWETRWRAVCLVMMPLLAIFSQKFGCVFCVPRRKNVILQFHNRRLTCACDGAIAVIWYWTYTGNLLIMTTVIVSTALPALHLFTGSQRIGDPTHILWCKLPEH